MEFILRRIRWCISVDTVAAAALIVVVIVVFIPLVHKHWWCKWKSFKKKKRLTRESKHRAAKPLGVVEMYAIPLTSLKWHFVILKSNRKYICMPLTYAFNAAAIQYLRVPTYKFSEERKKKKELISSNLVSKYIGHIYTTSFTIESSPPFLLCEHNTH